MYIIDMKVNQKGFTVAVWLLLLIIVGLVGATGWHVLRTDQASKETTKQVQDKEDTEDATETEVRAEKGAIIVMFNDDISRERQTEIIAAEKASIERRYESSNGYLLHVKVGQEQENIDAFLKYKEVKTVGLNYIDSPSSTQ